VRRVAGVVALSVAGLLLAACSVPRTIGTEVACDPQTRSRQILMTQAVPSATLIPCMQTLPPGWTYSGSDVRSGKAVFWLDSDRAGIHAVEVELTAGCSVDGLNESASYPTEIGVEVYTRPISLTPFEFDRVFVFPGGCVTYRYRFGNAQRAPTLAAEIDRSLTFLNRSDFVRGVKDGEFGSTLCGAGAPPCVGEE
jgi:hypothetical protein